MKSVVKNIDLSNYSSVLQKKEGIWTIPFDTDISFPEDAYDICFSIEDSSFWFLHRNNCIMEVMNIFSPDGIILDVGGGNGFVTRRLEEEGFSTVLVEPGQGGVQNGKKRGVQNIVHSTLESAQFYPNTIGGICLFDVIEHLENETIILTMIKKLLKKDGMLYITVPAFSSLWSTIDDESGHYRRYSLKSLCSLLENCGYKILFKTYFFSILPFPQYLMRVLPSIFKRSTHNSNKDHAPGKMISYLLEWIWKWERKRLRKGKSISFGSSCMLVAVPVNKD